MAEPKQASVVDSMGETPQAAEFGAALREMRIAYDRSVADVAADLRIRQVYLVAIEAGRFDDLPGPAYALGFVRAYATYLGLDVPEVIKRYREATGDAADSSRTPLVPPSPVAAEGGLPTGSVLLVAAVLALFAYGGWYYLSIDGRDAGNVVTGLPQRFAALIGLQDAPPPLARKTPAPAEQSSPAAQDAAEPASQPAPPDPATDETAAPPPSQAAPAPEPEAATGTAALGAQGDGTQGDATETAATESSPVAASETPPEVAAPAAPEPQAATVTEVPAAPEPRAAAETEVPAAPEPQAAAVTEAPAAPSR